MDVVVLYRPVGAEELALIQASGMRAFPPRLPEQPIFYPVTNEDYAAEIASKWNSQHGAGVSYVTRFSVEAAYAGSFPRKVVGAARHEELWVPAEELATFNQHLVGPIEVIAEFHMDCNRSTVVAEGSVG